MKFSFLILNQEQNCFILIKNEETSGWLIILFPERQPAISLLLSCLAFLSAC